VLNLFTDDVRRNPFPLYDQVRSASPVFHDARSNLWMIFDYEGVKRPEFPSVPEFVKNRCQNARERAS